jgi:hypothetical protein
MPARLSQAPKPKRRIVAVLPKQHPPRRAAGEFLKLISARFSKARE